jgi:zinc/manganese transport system permease protein
MNGDPQLTWNLIEDVRQLFDYPFMVNAFRAGTIVAVAAALIGWFMVLRRQTFAGHTLAVVSFPGAAGALLAGYAAEAGSLVFALAAALIFAVTAPATQGARTEESAVIGTLQAFALACGFLFVSLSSRNLTGAQSLLFGTFLGIAEGQVLTLLAGAVGALAVLGVIARPLLFASIDPDVAAARGVPIRLLSAIFLMLLGVAAAEASQITGALLIFALLVLPPATAMKLTARPAASACLSVTVALAVTWLGLAFSYYNDYPIGFYITSFAFAAYVLASGWEVASRRLPERRAHA